MYNYSYYMIYSESVIYNNYFYFYIVVHQRLFNDKYVLNVNVTRKI